MLAHSQILVRGKYKAKATFPNSISYFCPCLQKVNFFFVAVLNYSTGIEFYWESMQ